jgi:sugar O-acyltransferase (sialic acid O-acetyltransferase NeuD family)
VIGAGGHGKGVVGAASEAGWRVVAILDDDVSLEGRHVLGVKVAGATALLEQLEHDFGVIGVGTNCIRAAIAGRTTARWASVVHPSAVVHRSAVIEPGAVVFAGAVIQPDCVVGAHAIINTGAIVDHDCRIADFAHVAPRCALAGNVTVGEGAFLGVGAAVLPGVTIGEWAVVGGGAVVIRDVAARVTVAGVPAAILGRGV